MNDAQWLAERRNSIGASEAYDAVFNPLRLYLRKTDPHFTEPDNPRMRWGRKLEDVVAQAYHEETGYRTEAPRSRLIRNSLYPWLHASLDQVAWQIDEAGYPHTPHVLECKTASDRVGWGEPGTDEIPDRVLLQCQQQLLCTRLERCDVAVLFGVHDFRVYHVAPHRQLTEYLVNITQALWERIERRRPPEADWQHPDTPRLMQYLYRPQAGVVVELDGLEGLVEDYQRLGAEQRFSEDQRAMVKARLIEAMGQAERAHCGRYTLSRKVTQVAEKLHAGFERHDFRVSRRKET